MPCIFFECVGHEIFAAKFVLRLLNFDQKNSRMSTAPKLLNDVIMDGRHNWRRNIVYNENEEPRLKRHAKFGQM